MDDLNNRYYKSEGLSWIVFLLIVSNRYLIFDIIDIPYLGIVKNLNIVHISVVFLLLFIWSQVEYIQSNVINKSKVILCRNASLWLLLAATISFNIYIQGYTEIEVFAWIVGYFVLGMILGNTLIISLIMDILAVFIKKYRSFVFDNFKGIVISVVVLYFIYYLTQRYTPNIIFENITFPIATLGIILSMLKQLAGFLKHKSFEDFQRFRQQITYMRHLDKFGQSQKGKMSKLLEEAFKQNAVIDAKTNKPTQLNKVEQKEIIKQIKQDDYKTTQSPKDTQKQVREHVKNIFDGENHSLCYAVTHGNIEEVKILLETINPNDETAEAGWNPLLMAVANGYYDITDILLKKGANPDKANLMGITPLLYACRYDDFPTMKKLIEYGADINCIDEKGINLLMRAVMSNSKEIVLYLLSKGIVLKKKQAIKIAEQNGNGDIARILRRYRVKDKQQ